MLSHNQALGPLCRARVAQGPHLVHSTSDHIARAIRHGHVGHKRGIQLITRVGRVISATRLWLFGRLLNASVDNRCALSGCTLSGYTLSRSCWRV